MLGINKSAKSKLGAGLGVIVVLVILLGAFSMFTLSKTSAITERIYSKNLTGLQSISNLSVQINSIRGAVIGLQGALMFSKPDLVQSLKEDIKQTQKEIHASWDTYYPRLTTTKKERQAAQEFMARFNTFEPKIQKLFEIVDKGFVISIRNFYFEKMRGDFLALINKLSALKDIQSASAAGSYADGMAAAHQDRRIILAIVVAAVVLTMLLAYFLIRMITRPLGRARQLVESIGAGRLDNTVDNPFKDEFGAMLNALLHMQQQLAGIVNNVRNHADSVNMGSKEIASGNDELSSRTQEQAANLEQTAASMEEMTSTVKQNADNATQADHLTRSVRTQATKGGEVVGRAVGAMKEIDESSRKITDIIKLIDDIAFQTNLLALNASVEAARAGEQGRGFAVVASEVRNLAGRSAEAAKDIKALVEDSATKVKAGSEQVELSGRTLEEIIESINKVSDIVSEIATASGEQSSGIDQVSLAVQQMDNTTQQNAALVEQSAAASRSLEEQAEALRREVAFFKLSEHDDDNADESMPLALSSSAGSGLAANATPSEDEAAAANNGDQAVCASYEEEWAGA